MKLSLIKNIYYYGYSTNINENARIPNYVKKVFSVGYLLEKSDLLISPDTSILHLAEFQKVNTIGLYFKNSNNDGKNSPKIKL